ncbi:hypothetical protein Poly51_46030 [Rubripirellula tenax]|uniref:Uncharacterized protein n=1 Tax=Rubripirellula tenax TaxID=2528015 RepID=A0A5C6EI38_9BACT|nr:hypothetical protein [Rubripirellula tenax]TWU48702.1 hypothetical protein Poly51_46030 [Rubripirellula tenax]
MTSTWTETDFDSLGWHDIHVHGFRIVEGEHGVGDLWLDLDYILEWVPPAAKGGAFRFRIAPASLVFRDVTSLRLALDYATPTASMGPFSLDGIEREPISFDNGCNSFRWAINVNWPDGEMTFESPGFTQTLSGPIIESDAQYLTDAERNGDAPVA